MSEIQQLRDDVLELDRQIRRLRAQQQQRGAGDFGRANAIIGVLPSANVPAHGSIGLWTNQSGGALGIGAVVIQNGDRQFDTTTTVDDLDVVGVLTEAVANTADGRLRHQGYHPSVIVEGAVVAGQFLRTSTTAGAAEDAGATPTSGTFGVALTAAAGPGAGTVAAYLYGAIGGGGGVTCDLSAYTITNVTTDRTYDADATSVDELADVLGTLIDDLDGCLGGSPDLPGTRVYRNTTQSIPDATTTAISFNAENFDDDGWHDLVVNPSRITVDANGRYLITGGCSWVFNATGYRQAIIRINGAAAIEVSTHPTVTTSGFGSQESVVSTYDLSAGDYVELEVRQDSGGALNITAVEYTFLAVQRL